MRRAHIDISVLRQIVDYDPLTGVILWKERPLDLFTSRLIRCPEGYFKSWNKKYAGKPAFNVADGLGYLFGRLDGRHYFAHHIAWAITYGVWPVRIDHIDDMSNRIANLRDATGRQNSRNMRLSKANTSGVMGVVKARKKWRATILNDDGKTVHLGTFDAIEDAAKARKEAEVRLGYHPNHGRRPHLVRPKRLKLAA